MAEKITRATTETDYPQISTRAVLDIIQSRRSLREDFGEESISDEDIDRIIQAGLVAPSSKNAQPWRVHVLKQGQRMQKIADAVHSAKGAERFVPTDPTTGQPREWSSTVTESAQVLRCVGVGLFIENISPFSGGRASLARANDSINGNGLLGYSFEMIGFGAMIENMWLSAHALGYGGVFMGDVLIVEDEIKTELSLEGDLVGVLALGRTAMQPHHKTLRPDTIVWHASEGAE